MNMKKMAFILLILTALLCFSIASAELSSPGNPHWKPGSTATATWDAVDGANYYRIKVHVYHDNTDLGEAETGTSSLEIDLQAQINALIGEAEYSTVDVCFSVAAADTSNPEAPVISAYSDYSEYCIYQLSHLAVPTNVSIDENGVLSWDLVDGAEYYEYYPSVIFNGEEIGPANGFINEYTVEGNRASCDMKGEILHMYANLCGIGQIHKGDTVQISFALIARAWIDSQDNYSAPSDYTESYTYSNEDLFVLTVPQNVCLDEDGVLSWDLVDGAEYYEYYPSVIFNGEEIGPSNGFINEYTVEGNRASCDMKGEILHMYANLCGTEQIHKGDTVQISFALIARAWIDSQDYYTAPSDYTENYTYSNEDLFVLTVPQNVCLDEGGVLSWDLVDGAEYYEYYPSVIFNGEEIGPANGFINEFTVEGNRASCDMKGEILHMYTNLCGTEQIHKGDTVQISFALIARAWIDSRDYYTAPSDYTGSYSFDGGISVTGIQLSPSDPLLYKGNSMWLGVTITPENAFYQKVDWTSSDETIATVDSSGAITGLMPGNVTITASIDDVSEEVNLTVYTIESNIEDETDAEEVTDTAGAIIDDLGNNESPDLSNTDLSEEAAEDVHDQIHEAIERGDVFRSDIVLSKRDWAHFKKYWGDIQDWLDNGAFAGGYEINVEIYHQDGLGNKHHVANITQFDNEIGFTVETDSLPEVAPGQLREFILIRIHDEVLEAIPVRVNPDGSFSAKTDRFSDFVLLYEDNQIIASGTCGENANWQLSGNGTLTISGSGDIASGYVVPYDYRTSVETVIIEDGITGIGDNAFSNLPNITGVTIPEGVTFIGSCAFRYCSSLVDINLPASITRIGEFAFVFCNELETLTLPEGIETSVFTRLYEGNLVEIVLPSGIQDLDLQYGAFIGTKVGTPLPFDIDFVLPEYTNRIDAEAFEGISAGGISVNTEWDTSLTISSKAFSGCKKLQYFWIDGYGPSELHIADDAFAGCSSDLTIVSGFDDEDLSEQLETYAVNHGFNYMENERYIGDG